jgi:adenine C2-methylase RlmN of 23S rRNA A2503 and tRNA A37
MSTAASPLPAISDLDPSAVAQLVADLGLEKYRSAQILDAIWRSDATTWSEVTTLSRRAQEALAGVARFYSTARPRRASDHLRLKPSRVRGRLPLLRHG